MAAPSETDEQAWRRHAVELERGSFAFTTAFLAGIFPIWCAFDYWASPPHFREFGVIRVAVALGAVVASVLIRRSRSSAFDHAATVVPVLASGIAVAYFIEHADSHVSLYTIGFSLIFWGFGLLLLWRWWIMVACFAVILAAHLAYGLQGDSADDPGAFFGLLAYLVTSAGIATSVSAMRRVLERRAFFAALEIARKNRELAAALATLEDAQARFVATEKLSALGRLIAQLSHEINNPVNVIENNLEPIAAYVASLDEVLALAHDRAADGDGALARRWAELDIDFVRTDLREAIAAMATAAERIRTIQSDLRTFMRGDATLPTEGDFNAGVRSTVAILKRNLPPETELIERYAELPPVRFHTGQLNQVTMNLLQNALDVIGGSGGGRIEVETRLEPDALVLSVADTGPGVSEHARRHLFEPFFTTKEVGKGTGLGLATCYQILRAHGGSIALDESYRRGARFVVRLPLAPPPPPSPVGPADDRAPALAA